MGLRYPSIKHSKDCAKVISTGTHYCTCCKESITSKCFCMVLDPKTTLNIFGSNVCLPCLSEEKWTSPFLFKQGKKAVRNVWHISFLKILLWNRGDTRMMIIPRLRRLRNSSVWMVSSCHKSSWLTLKVYWKFLLFNQLSGFGRRLSKPSETIG